MFRIALETRSFPMNQAVKSPKRSALRGYAFAATTVVLGLGVSLTAGEWILKYQRLQVEGSDRMDPGMILYDPRLGWRLAADWAGTHHNWDFDAAYSINRYGMRGDSGDPEGQRILALVGDSFAFGQGVNDDQTLVHHLNRLSEGRKTHLNFAVPGYSTDQQLLLVRQRVWLFGPETVVLVVYLGNDLFDNMLAYPLQGDQGKPRFHLQGDGRLGLRNVPVPLEGKPAAARGKTLSSIVLGEGPPQATGLAGWLGRLEISRRLGIFQSEPEISEAEMDKRFAPPCACFEPSSDECATRSNSGGPISGWRCWLGGLSC